MRCPTAAAVKFCARAARASEPSSAMQMRLPKWRMSRGGKRFEIKTDSFDFVKK